MRFKLHATPVELPRYRPEIDGLRAIAILPVVFFHADIQGFSGGYVGVDVFFVISGYLITAIVGRDSMAGTQFHPEKSQKLGLALIANFLKWKP